MRWRNQGARTRRGARGAPAERRRRDLAARGGALRPVWAHRREFTWIPSCLGSWAILDVTASQALTLTCGQVLMSSDPRNAKNGGNRMPRNTEVQAKLARVVGELGGAGLELDPEAQERVGELIAAAADRIEQADRLDDPDAIDAAESALRTLLRGAFVESTRGRTERRGAEGAVESAMVKEAAIMDVLRRICPLWPICV